MNSTRKFQFGIGAILFAMVVVAGYFWGVNRGETVRYNTTLSSVVYPARNLLSGNQSVATQLDEIANLIKTTIAPESWTDRGGMASLHIYPANQSIVVNQYGAEHEKIGELFDSLEAIAGEKRYFVDYDVSELFSPGAQKTSHDQLSELCAIAKQKMVDWGAGEFELVPSADGVSIRIVARKDLHNLIAAYLEQLRGARSVFARIDG